jgi:hypothetical protein
MKVVLLGPVPVGGGGEQLWHLIGWSETTATNASVQDEAIQAVLGMNQKHIFLPCPGIFQPSSLPQNFPLLPTPPPLLPTSALLPPSPHFISCSLHLQSLEELMSLSSIEFQGDVDTRLEEGGELNVEGIWREKSKRTASSQMQKGEKITLSTFLFLLYDLFVFVVFFFFFLIFDKR